MFSNKADQLIMMCLFILVMLFIGVLYGTVRIVEYIKLVDEKVTETHTVVNKNSYAIDNLKYMMNCTVDVNKLKNK